MADTDIVQVIAEARVDAQSLSEFVFKPADFMVQRRLAPPINTLNYFLQYFNAISSIYTQAAGSVTLNGVTRKTIGQIAVDAENKVKTDVIDKYSTLVNRGAWAASTAYDLFDLVTVDGVAYITLSNHTSGDFATDLAAGKWSVYRNPNLADLQGYTPLYKTYPPILAERDVRIDFNPSRASLRYGLSDTIALDDNKNHYRGLVNKDAWANENIGVGSVAFGRNNAAYAYLTTALGHDCITYGVASMAGGAGTGTGNPDAPNDSALGTAAVGYGYCSFAFGKDTLAKGRVSTAFGNASVAGSIHSFAVGNEAKTGEGLTIHPNGVASTGESAIAQGFRAEAYGDYAIAQGAFVTAHNGAHVYGSGINFGTKLINSTPNSIAMGRGVDVPTVFMKAGLAANGAFGFLGFNTKDPKERIEAVIKNGDKFAIRADEVGAGNGSLDLQGTLTDGSGASIFRVDWTSTNGGQAYGVTKIYQNNVNWLEIGLTGNIDFKTAVNSRYDYRVNGVKVVGSQLPAIADATETLASVTAQLNAALAALRAHGLIAT